MTRNQPSVWYIDIIEGIEPGEDGVAVFIDKYLDVIMTPEGDVKVDDRDELDAAYASGDLTKAQYEAALAEGEAILRAYGDDIRGLDAWCAAVRQLAEDRVAAPCAGKSGSGERSRENPDTERLEPV